jgi:hypothetical protein
MGTPDVEGGGRGGVDDEVVSVVASVTAATPAGVVDDCLRSSIGDVTTAPTLSRPPSSSQKRYCIIGYKENHQKQ